MSFAASEIDRKLLHKAATTARNKWIELETNLIISKRVCKGGAVCKSKKLFSIKGLSCAGQTVVDGDCCAQKIAEHYSTLVNGEIVRLRPGCVCWILPFSMMV